jgi:hypothetical protein
MSSRAPRGALLTESGTHADGLAVVEAPGAFEQRKRGRQLAAIDDGLLRRGRYVATRVRLSLTPEKILRWMSYPALS